MKSGNLNFLEPSGSLQACNGTALPLPYNVSIFFYPEDENGFSVEISVSVRLQAEDYKTNDLGVISNCIKIGTGFNRDRNATCYRETNLKIIK
jgi:hypothetical protein